MFPSILIFWYPCRDWLAGNSQAFPGPDATIRAIPDKNYSSIYLHTLASICKKVLTLLSQAVATWPLGKTTTIWRWKPCQTRWPNIYISMTKKIFSIILSEVLQYSGTFHCTSLSQTQRTPRTCTCTCTCTCSCTYTCTCTLVNSDAIFPLAICSGSLGPPQLISCSFELLRAP